MIGSVSVAVPVNDGVASLEGVFGWLSVTLGELVSIVNVLTALVPVLPALSLCLACAV